MFEKIQQKSLFCDMIKFVNHFLRVWLVPGMRFTLENNMIDSLIIREENPADITEIRELTAAAFENIEISNHTEHFVIDALRAAGALTISLVAVFNEQIVGHNAFSPIEISDGTTDWYAMGPLSVLPQYQRLGIGGMLIREGLTRLKAINASGCYLVGHPQYYRRFGFENIDGLYCEGVSPEVSFALSFTGTMPQGKVSYHPAFFVSGPLNEQKDQLF